MKRMHISDRSMNNIIILTTIECNVLHPQLMPLNFPGNDPSATCFETFCCLIGSLGLREDILAEFCKEDTVLWLVIATSAFGLGVNIPNITRVIIGDCLAL